MGIPLKGSRVIAVRNLDERWGKLDTNQCETIRGYRGPNYYTRTFLHITKNNRYFVENRPDSHRDIQVFEITIDGAMDWIYEQFGTQPPVELKKKLWVHLQDVASTPDARHGERLVLKCARCRALERELEKKTEEKRSRKTTAIVDCLLMADSPLSAKEIARATGLKADSNLRSRLSELVMSGVVLKSEFPRGYIHSMKKMS
jgi:hypothetical protein